mgnify:CR=1 FL=1
MNANTLKKELRQLANPEQAIILQRFFKTNKGGYAEGDVFLGLRVPLTRSICKKYSNLSIEQIEILLHSKIHEFRLAALLICVAQAKKADEQKQNELYKFYLKNTLWINNWDLVDLSAEHIIGKYLFDKDKSVLFDLAKSKKLWERRISILSSFYFIKQNEFEVSLELIELLLEDKHDLIHKACGWMLREIGKRNFEVLFSFLKSHYRIMPRTMLRYSIEKFPKDLRQKFLMSKI